MSPTIEGRAVATTFMSSCASSIASSSAESAANAPRRPAPDAPPFFSVTPASF